MALHEDHTQHYILLAVSLVLVLMGFSPLLWSRSEVYTAESLLSGMPSVAQFGKEHRKEFSEVGIFKVTEGVHMARGFALGNSIFLDGPEGVVVVDVTESMEAATEVYKAFREMSKAPIKGIIYTHNHPDHINGAKVFADDPDNLPEIWAHASFTEELMKVATVNMAHFTKAMRQFGVYVPPSVNKGIPLKLRLSPDLTMGSIPPTHHFEGNTKDITIAGLAMQLVHIPGETPDQIGVWLPDQRVFLSADDVYKAFPNLYAIRGTAPRDILTWVNSIDIIRKLRPKYLVPSHGNFLDGEDFIYETLTEYRDAIQYVHDQTVRYTNKGLYPDDIVAKVKLPEKLKKNLFLQEYYGTVEWSVKGVYNQYMGWFSGNPAELSSMATRDRAEKMIALAGGQATLCNHAKEALQAGDAQWALELASHVFLAYPDKYDARAIRLEALKVMASRQTSPNGRNYYLTMALEDYKVIENTIPPKLKENAIQQMSIPLMFRSFQGRLMPEACEGVEDNVVFNFTDVKVVYTLHLRHGILEVVNGDSDEWNIKVTTTITTWKDVLSQKLSAFSAYMNGDIIIDGGALDFRRFVDYFERS